MSAKHGAAATPPPGESFGVHSVRSRYATGFVWNALGAAFGQGGTFLGSLIVANVIGQQAFGHYSFAQTTFLMVSGVAQLATGFTATKYVAEFRSTDPAKASRILGLCSLLSLTSGVLATVALVAASPLLDAPDFAKALALGASFVLFSVMNGFQMGAMAGLEGYRSIARAAGIHFFCHLALCFALSWVWGLAGAVGALAASAALRWIAFRFALDAELDRSRLFVDYRHWRQERRVFVHFALPAAVSGLCAYPAFWLPNVLVVEQPGGYAQMALLGAALSLKLLVSLPATLLNGVGTSIINRQRGLGDAAGLRRAYWTNLAAVGATVLVCGSVVLGLGPWLLALYGRDFVAGYPILAILVASTLPEVLSSAVYQSAQSQERIWQCFFLVWLPRDITLVAASFVLVSSFGAAGAAMAHVVAWSVALAAMAAIATRIGFGIRSD